MRAARGWMGRVIVASTLVALACISCSTSEAEGLVTRELARQDVGPAGGTVTGGAVTIEIPEGALTTTQTIIINEALDPSARRLPADTQIAGGLYVLQPDDVTFAKPVTVTVQIDESKKRADGKGALMLFRGTGSNAWTPYGADETKASVVVGKTTHFSLWAPTAAAETYCYLNQCHAFALAGPTADGNTDYINVLPGLDCRVPEAGDAGVACAGTAADKGPPYQCRCVGSDVILGTWERIPPDTAISAMAQQCGAPACPPKPTYACDLGVVCSDSPNGWVCSTSRDPRILCNGGASGASCVCAGSADRKFDLPNTNKLTNEDLVGPFQSICGGSCENAGSDPNSERICPGSVQGEKDGKCWVETAGTCRDDHVYRAECSAPAGSTQIGECTCMVDGVATKTVRSTCNAASFVCAFPKALNESTTQQCPSVMMGPLTESAEGPSGCLAQTAGTCRDGHLYRAECEGFPAEVSNCKCLVDGAVTKSIRVACDDAPTACGFPSSK